MTRRKRRSPDVWDAHPSDDGKWLFSWLLDQDEDGHVVIGALRIEPTLEQAGKVPRGGITSSTLRDFPIGAHVAKARASLARWGGPPMVDDDPSERLSRLKEAAKQPAPKRGRAGYTDDFYRRIALEYLRLQGEGVTKGILKRLAEAESKRLRRAVPRETVRDWVHQARKRGFLTAGTVGRAGAEPGERLLAEQKPAARKPARGRKTQSKRKTTKGGRKR